MKYLSNIKKLLNLQKTHEGILSDFKVKKTI